MAIDKKLKELRRIKGWTQGDLSKISGINIEQIKKYETGRSEPAVKTLEKLSIAFGITLNELINSEQGSTREDLKILFEAVERFNEEEKKTVKEILKALIMKNDAEKLRKV